MNWITKFIKPKLKTLFKKQQKNNEESLWTTCSCQQLIYKEDLFKNLHVCPKCEMHHKISCHDRFSIFFDEGIYNILSMPQPPDDPLQFVDKKNIPIDFVKQENLLIKMMLLCLLVEN